MLTQDFVKENIREFNIWANSPKGRKIWMKINDRWEIFDSISDYLIKENVKIIVDDKFAELKKAQIDGQIIQKYIPSMDKWVDCGKCSFTEVPNSSPEKYRIKPEESKEYPKFKMAGYEVALFDNNRCGRILISDEIERIGYYDSTLNESAWEDIETIEINGKKFYNKQPVWCWNSPSAIRKFAFIDAKNKCVVTNDGYRVYKNYAPVKKFEKWMIDQWQGIVDRNAIRISVS